MRHRIVAALALAIALPEVAATQTTPTVGMRENPPGVHALTNARIVTAPGRVLQRGTLVIRDGVIEAVGASAAAPRDARVWDLAGRTIYPGFIDAYTNVGMRDSLRPADTTGARGAVYWNPQVRSFITAVDEFAANDEERPRALRSAGFTVGMVVPQLGLFRGQTAAVSLGTGSVAGRIIRDGIAQSAMMGRDPRVGNVYPTSSMGAISFIRQTLIDADWHARAHETYDRAPAGLRRPESNAALAALVPVLRKERPIIFETDSPEETLRALAIGREFGIDLWLRGSGAEYQMVDEIAKVKAPLILPLNFPAAPSVTRPAEALNVSLGDLRHWYLAPENPSRLAAAGVEFALTASGTRNPADFLTNVRSAVARGLSRDVALAALTTVPARYMGITRTHGSLEVGKVANIVVAQGDVFTNGTRLEMVWVDGEPFEVTAATGVDPRGRWRIVAAGQVRVEGTLTLSGTRDQLSGSFAAPGATTRLTTARIGGQTPQIDVAFAGDPIGHEGIVRMTGSATATELRGWGELPDGSRFNWTGERIGAAPGDSAAATAGGADTSRTASRAPATATLTLPVRRPSIEYGRSSAPQQPAAVLVRGATIWTMTSQGIMENADLLVTRGRVTRVGRNLTAPAGATVIDGVGKHVTPGLIDAHLHSGASGGINETGSAIVPEVRIADVITMDNIWMYRQLAGGLTTAHVMHGSANPIGGQNQVVKLRWGALPSEQIFAGAPRTVKFALGENPKRREDRYPDTRMGTEQIIRDHFLAAREYERAQKAWATNKRGIAPRRDLRMEALVDILNGDILVMSHSYRQDEILMLMRLAEEFDFRIKAFHHTVEAFKVAPELAAHGAGAVIWSDWGAFKMEAFDNTTFNARILRDAGVLTSLHSDNSQIASRMNWEAAKTLRTGLTEQEALALVTINTAKILGIDSRVGSLDVDKDADFVIWSDNPLSTETRAEQTWIDGRKYYDIEEDRRQRDEVARERSRLIQLILQQR